MLKYLNITEILIMIIEFIYFIDNPWFAIPLYFGIVMGIMNLIVRLVDK